MKTLERELIIIHEDIDVTFLDLLDFTFVFREVVDEGAIWYGRFHGVTTDLVDDVVGRSLCNVTRSKNII